MVKSDSWWYIFKVYRKVLFNSLFINSTPRFWKIKAMRLFHMCKKSIVWVFSLISDDILYSLNSCWFQTFSFNLAESQIVVSRLKFKMIDKFYSIIVDILTLSKVSRVHCSIGVISWNNSSKVSLKRFLLGRIRGQKFNFMLKMLEIVQKLRPRFLLWKRDDSFLIFQASYLLWKPCSFDFILRLLNSYLILL